MLLRTGGFWTPGAAAYTAFALDFDDTDDKLTRATDLAGNANSKLVTASFWFKRDGTGDDIIYDTIGTAFRIWTPGTGDKLTIWGENAAGTRILDVDTTATFVGPTAWHHCAFSADLANTSNRHLLINGTSDANWNTYTNDTIDFTQTDHSLGVNISGSSAFWDGCLAEVWIDFGRYVDFSQASNLQKFRSATGKPVSLGSDGSTPFGAAPLMYFTSFDTAANWNNKGAGGTFTQAGTPVACATSPSS